MSRQSGADQWSKMPRSIRELCELQAKSSLSSAELSRHLETILVNGRQREGEVPFDESVLFLMWALSKTPSAVRMPKDLAT